MGAVNQSIQAALNAGGAAPMFACRAWVNFNGTVTAVIQASGNVSSVTDNGSGDYTINFTTAMEDSNYAIAAACTIGDSTGATFSIGVKTSSTSTAGAPVQHSTSGVRVLVQASSGANVDASIVSILVMR